jgi:hypothetical protein
MCPRSGILDKADSVVSVLPNPTSRNKPAFGVFIKKSRASF